MSNKFKIVSVDACEDAYDLSCIDELDEIVELEEILRLAVVGTFTLTNGKVTVTVTVPEEVADHYSGF